VHHIIITLRPIFRQFVASVAVAFRPHANVPMSVQTSSAAAGHTIAIAARTQDRAVADC
jgi:hypothetical protein